VIPENITRGSGPARCPECDRLRADLAERDREVAALRRRLDEAERRARDERGLAEPKEGR
jgi:hypothetical protein